MIYNAKESAIITSILIVITKIIIIHIAKFVNNVKTKLIVFRIEKNRLYEKPNSCPLNYSLTQITAIRRPADGTIGVGCGERAAYLASRRG